MVKMHSLIISSSSPQWKSRRNGIVIRFRLVLLKGKIEAYEIIASLQIDLFIIVIMNHNMIISIN